MREIIYHRRASKYLARMPRDRQEQMLRCLEEVAGLADLSDHPDVRPMKGDWKDWHRLRVGSYRSVLKVTIILVDEVIYVDYIGPRGDAY